MLFIGSAMFISYVEKVPLLTAFFRDRFRSGNSRTVTWADTEAVPGIQADPGLPDVLWKSRWPDTDLCDNFRKNGQNINIHRKKITVG